MTSPAVTQTQSVSKKDTKTTPALTTVTLKPSATQITPSLSAPTVTTQVRSRPLPAILPAPPKPSSVTQAPQAPAGVSTTASVRKLPTILPAPAKNVAVFPTVLVPMATGVSSHAGAQLQSSVPLAVSSPVSGTVGTLALNEVIGQQYPSVVPASHDTGLIAATQGNLFSETHGSEMNENSELSVMSSSKLPVLNEQSSAAECDNNTSSEDDSLLMCSETIDSGCNITEVPSAMDFFTNVVESTPIKDQAEHDATQMPQTVLESAEECETVLDPLSLQDIELSVSDLDTDTATQKDLTSEAQSCETQPEAAPESIENVTVQRLDVSSEISDIVDSGLSEDISPESLHMADHEDEKIDKPDPESELCSSLGSAHYGDQNVVEKGGDDGLPVENALQIIESFVESMEASSEAEETKHSSNDSPEGFLQSSSLESSALPELLITEKGNANTEQMTNATDDKSLGEGQNLNILPKFEEESWDVSDTPIDVLSTSTSSSNSATESFELTEKEIKALEAFGNIRTSGRKRKPPTSLDVSPPRQISGWVRGALR